MYICKACGTEVDSDFKYCRECQEFIEPIEVEECELGGDNTDCKSCAYYPDFEWDPDSGYCKRREEE